MAQASDYFFLVILVSLIRFLSTAPTNNGTITGHWNDPSTDVKPATTTTAAPVRAELICEKEVDTNDMPLSVAMAENIQKLIGEYNDWGKLLAPAPAALGILGQLIIMANQVKDFPINSETPNKGFKYIEYPNSFQTTLLQISQKGYKAFLTAHRNMDAIRIENDAVPSDIKEAIRYLASTNEGAIHLRLPYTIERIRNAASNSQKYATKVVEEFSEVLGLIDETELAMKNTAEIKEIEIDDVKFNITTSVFAKKISEKVNLILMKKDARMKRMMNMLEKRRNNLNVKTDYGTNSFNLNLAKDWVEQIGKERYTKDKEFLNNKTITWNYSYSIEFIASNPCIQKNSQNLLDLLIAFKGYRISYKNWQNSISKNRFFNPSEVIGTFERNFGTLENCTEINGLIKKGDDLLKKMKSPDTFPQSKRINKKAPRPCEVEIKEIVVLIRNLQKNNTVILESERQTGNETNSLFEMYGLEKRRQLDQLHIMLKTLKGILELNNELMKIRKEKTRQVLKRLAELNITKVNIGNVIRILREAMEELVNLKNHWSNLIQFFDKINTFIKGASRNSEGLLEVINSMSNHPSELMENKFMLGELEVNFQKCNEAVLLVHGIADMYVNVSNLYIKDRLVRLNSMNSMRVNGMTDEQLKLEKMKLMVDATEASQGIENYIKDHEKKLNGALKKRHEGILNEYKKITECIRNHGLHDRAVNFSEYDWFQIRFVLNDKVLEVSSENQVQIWESNGGDNQLWYLDDDEIIRSVVNDFCLTSNVTEHIIVEPCRNNAINQKWILERDLIINIENSDRVLNIQHENENINGARLYEIDIKTIDGPLWEQMDRPVQ